jgi:hypothetical protein
MKKLLTLLALLSLLGGSAIAQVPGASQNFQEFNIAAPPTVTVGQSYSTSTATGASTSLTGGAVAAGSYRICVTFYTLANTETPCSVDTAATSVITTTGSTSTVTITPPIPAAGGQSTSLVGWRMYIGASGGASAAETLQTINATVCTLSTSSTPSCSLNSSATFTASTNFSAGGGGPAAPGTALQWPLSNAANMSLFENSLYPTAILNWVVTGSAPTACTIQLQLGATVAGLANAGQSLTCTSTGSYALPSVTLQNYISPSLTAWTGAANGTSVETFTITVLPYPLGAFWGPATPTSACTVGTGLFSVNGTTTSTLFTCVAGTWTAVTLP